MLAHLTVATFFFLLRRRYDTITEGIGIDRMTENFNQGWASIDHAYKGTDQEVQHAQSPSCAPLTWTLPSATSATSSPSPSPQRAHAVAPRAVCC